MRTLIHKLCQAIVQDYRDEVISCPTDQNEWRAIAEDFQRRWKVPHACWALDGKHVVIRRSPKSGALFYNYKGLFFFIILLLALVDADFTFLWIYVGGYGSM